MLRLNCNNELDHVQLCILYRYKKELSGSSGTEMVPLGFLLQVSGHYELCQDYRVWDLKTFIIENTRELVMTGLRDMLTAKKQVVWQNS